jgi:hypothetical protein
MIKQNPSILDFQAELAQFIIYVGGAEAPPRGRQM